MTELEPLPPEEDADGDLTNPPAQPVGADEATSQLLMHYREEFQGPLPPPSVIERYAAVHAKAPEIIFRAFESQVKHRLEMEATLLHGSERRARLGQILGTILIGGGLAGGVVAIVVGAAGAGATIIVAALASGILSYVFGDRPRGKE